MKRWGWIALALHGFLATQLVAAPHVQNTVDTMVSVTQLTRGGDGLSLRLELASPTWEVVETREGNLQIARSPEGGGIFEAGNPAVPVLARFVRLSHTGGAHVEVAHAEYELLTDVEYAAYAGDIETESYDKNDSQPDAWFPEQLVAMGEPVLMRDFRVALLSFHPVQVNPARREVRLYSSLDIDLTYTSGSSVNELEQQPSHISETYLDQYRRLLDWEESELDQFTLYRGGIQVVTVTEALETLAPWIEWKRQKGWGVDLLTPADVPSWSASMIRNELRSRYAATDTPFDFVVIVGDGNGFAAVPPSGGTLGGYGDHGYTLLHGTDDLADVAIGRISVEIASQIAAYNNKVLFYEKTPYVANTGWFQRGMVAAGSEVSGASTILIGRYARHLMLDLGYTRVDTAWYNDGLTDVNERCRTAINNGVSFFLYRGLIGTGLGPEGIATLLNSHRTPFVLDITCSTGNWFGETGYNEAWMRAGGVTNPMGAIGAIGTATAYTHTSPNNALTGGALKSLFIDRNPHMGMAWYGAMMNLYQNFKGYNEEYVEQFSLWANLMGDPTVWLWTDVPHTFTVTAETTLDLGINGYPVQVYEGTGPVRDAWVTLYRSDELETVIAHGVTDGAGQVILEAPFRFPGNAVLTITGQNFKPTILPVAVNSSDRVGFVSFEIIDDGSEGTDGNSNGIADAGETVGLRLTAKNHGTVTLSSVTASITSEDEMIQSVSGLAQFGMIEAGSDCTATTLLLVEILPDVRDDWMSRINVTFSAGASEWEDILMLPLSAPKFTLVQTDVTGTLEPGETASLNIVLGNVGGSEAVEGTITLVSRDPYLAFPNATAPLPATVPGATGTAGPFTLTSDQSAFSGYPADYRILIETSTGQLDTIHARIVLGERSSNDPLGPDRYGYFAFDNTDLAYDKAPVYDWVEICPTSEDVAYSGSRLEGIVDSNYDMGDGEFDHAQVVDLPFPIQYYGESYDRMTIYGNGMVAMGVQPDMPCTRNWTIPSPVGPANMIAPYWDDRVVNVLGEEGSDRGVYHYYDEEGGRYIIEWYEVADWVDMSSPGHADISSCTFQLIFFDQAGDHVTWSGDNEILFQYAELTHSQGYLENDNPFYTTGIENGDQTDGLMCAYWDRTQTGMAEVNTGRAILFSTHYGPATSVADEPEVRPTEWVFDGVYPNPFNPTSTLRFSLKRNTHVTLRLFNVAGQEVARLQDGPMRAGRHEVLLDGSRLASGIYFATLEAGPMHETRKLVLLK